MKDIRTLNEIAERFNINEGKFDKFRRSNSIPTNAGDWTKLAKQLDAGINELDDIAISFGSFKDFEALYAAYKSPFDIYNESLAITNKLIKIIKQVVSSASNMSKGQFYSLIKKLEEDTEDTNVDEGMYQRFRRGNSIPTNAGYGWGALCKKLDAGILELDAIADDLGYEDFEDLDASYSNPAYILSSSLKSRFIKSIKKVVNKGNNMSPSKLEKMIIDLK